MIVGTNRHLLPLAAKVASRNLQSLKAVLATTNCVESLSSETSLGCVILIFAKGELLMPLVVGRK
jgi:hypothetical protein